MFEFNKAASAIFSLGIHQLLLYEKETKMCNDLPLSSLFTSNTGAYIDLPHSPLCVAAQSISKQNKWKILPFHMLLAIFEL